MHAIIRVLRQSAEIRWILLRIDTGLVPVLKRQPGFCAYYAIPVGKRRLFSVTLFRHRWQAELAVPMVDAWIARHLWDLLGHVPPSEVLEVSVAEPDC